MSGKGGTASLPMRMFWVGFIVRLLAMTIGHTYRVRMILDHFEFGWEMGRIARAMVTGYGFADPFNGHSGPTAWTPPLYPLLLAGVFKVFGVYTARSAWMILALNCIFSAATAPAVFEIGWRCFGRDAKGMKVALWSGWLWVLYPAAMQYAIHWIWDMALSAMLFAWVIVLALRVRGVGGEADEARNDTGGRWAGFGSLWGLIALSNSSLLVFLPACVVWMLWGRDRWTGASARVALRNVLLAGVCCVGLMTPWMVRNWLALHAFVPLRANFGAELYESVQFSMMGFPWGATLPLADSAPEFQRYKRLGEVRYGREQGARAVEIIGRNRGLFLARMVKRAYFYWVSVPHSSEKSIVGEVIRVLNYSFLSLGGLLGLGLALRRRVPGAWLFFWAFALTPLVYYAITVQARFRHPLEPLITVLIVYLFQSAELPGAHRRRLAVEP